jgi:hypothetical protein
MRREIWTKLRDTLPDIHQAKHFHTYRQVLSPGTCHQAALQPTTLSNTAAGPFLRIGGDALFEQNPTIGTSDPTGDLGVPKIHAYE